MFHLYTDGTTALGIIIQNCPTERMFQLGLRKSVWGCWLQTPDHAKLSFTLKFLKSDFIAYREVGRE